MLLPSHETAGKSNDRAPSKGGMAARTGLPLRPERLDETKRRPGETLFSKRRRSAETVDP